MAEQSQSDKEIVQLFLQHRSPKAVADILKIDEQTVNNTIVQHKQQIETIIDDLEKAEVWVDDRGELDVNKMLQQLSAVTLRFFREGHNAMEPQEFLATVEIMRKLLETTHKVRGGGVDKHLHLHMNAAEMLVKEIMQTGDNDGTATANKLG